MSSKTLWFDLLYNGRQVKNFYLNKIMVKSVRTEKNNPPIFFKEDDQPIDNHPIIKNYAQKEKVRFQKIKKIEMVFEKAKDLECYFDKKSSRLWFKKIYLTPEAEKSQETAKKIAKKRTPPKSVKKSNLSPSEAAKSRKSTCSTSKSSVQESRFDLNKHMHDYGFAKFDYKKVDLYRFMDAYEKGCSKLKFNDEDKIANFFLYLGQDAKREYLELQVYNPVSDWQDFKNLWVDNFHERTYDRLWNHLTANEPHENLGEFAQKKYEVFRNFFKTVSDLEAIQLINLSMPKDIQPKSMAKMFTSFPAYIKFLKEEAEKREEETESKESEENNEEGNGGNEGNDGGNGEEEANIVDQHENSDPGFRLFKFKFFSICCKLDA